MPTYAILGGTGNTGSALVKLLAESPSNVLHVYAPSRSKLLDAHPVLSQPETPHSIFTGDLNDSDLIAKCVENTDVVFGVVGTNFNEPKLHIAQDLAKAIVTAISTLRDGSGSPKDYKPPTIIFCTSAGMTSGKKVRANFPSYFHAIIQVVGKYIYADFREATAILRRPANIWVPTIFFCAPGLTAGPSQGGIWVGVDIPKNAPNYVTLPDLARGMVLAASEKQMWQNKEIGIVGAKLPKVSFGPMLFIFFTNTMAVIASPFWWLGRRRQ